MPTYTPSSAATQLLVTNAGRNQGKGPLLLADVDAALADDSVGEDKLVANELTGRAVANTQATADTGEAAGGIPVVYRIALPDAAGAINITLTHKTLIYNVQAIKTVQAGTAAGTLIVGRGASAITNAMAWDNTTADKAIVPAGTIDDVNATIAAGGTLRATTSQAKSDGVLLVFGLRVA